jgi:hypothetical protein
MLTEATRAWVVLRASHTGPIRHPPSGARLAVAPKRSIKATLPAFPLVASGLEGNRLLLFLDGEDGVITLATSLDLDTLDLSALLRTTGTLLLVDDSAPRS